jgi:hypothetical protein
MSIPRQSDRQFVRLRDNDTCDGKTVRRDLEQLEVPTR